MVQEIDISLLVRHPENANHMNTDALRKLRRHIEKTGRYEPLTVRPHPAEEGKFQIINGHNRLRVLRAIGRSKALCSVWELSDDEVRFYLATLNRLTGSDVAERRAVLIEGLLAIADPGELATLLPESRKRIEELLQLARIELDDLKPFQDPEDEAAPLPVILSFMLGESEAREVHLALDLVIGAAEGKATLGRALVELARFYLKHCTPVEKDVTAVG